MGQTPLHLCITNIVGAKVTKVMYNAWPDAVSAKNELSKTPLAYWCENGEVEMIGNIIGGKASKTTTVMTFVLKGNKKAAMMDEDPIFLRGHHLLLEVIKEHNDKMFTPFIKEVRKLFLEQLQSRNLLFDKLLTKFSHLIDFSDKKSYNGLLPSKRCAPLTLEQARNNLLNFK
eukprot:1703982-Ditylum_brightwellii.AAC.1